MNFAFSYTQPILLILLPCAFAGLWPRRWKRTPWLLLLALVGLVLVTVPAADWFISRPLESRYRVRPFNATPPPQAIVVLAGSVDPAHFERPYELLGYDTFERCQHGAWLYQKLHAPLLLCGGLQPSTGPAAAAMRRFMVAQGIPDAMIWTEEKSRNTYENALYGAEILRSHQVSRVALVVEAKGMLRAEACFRKQAIDVIPAPSRFRELGPWPDEILPSWHAVRNNEDTLHESLGLLWYWMHGYIDRPTWR